MPLPSPEEILRKAEELPSKPVAIEAFWDGDTTGWFLTLTAVVEKSSSSYTDFVICSLRGDGGDIRLFNSEVPPWPEAVLAATVGERLAKRFGVPFYFPSPNYPEDMCPRWRERKKGYPCRSCGILLLQHDPCPWRGSCYRCHLKDEQKNKQQGHRD